jgi:hypothetical protein
MSVVRVQRTVQVTLSHTFTVDGVDTDASGDVTVTVKRLDGTVVTSGTAAHPGPVGRYTFVLPAQANVDVLTVDWSGTFGGATVTVREAAEIVGGYLFGLGQARNDIAEVRKNPGRYSEALLADRRIVVEHVAEQIIGRAMVPRFARVACSGRGGTDLLTPHLMLRAVRAITVDGTVWTSDQLVRVVPLESGVLHLKSGCWPAGRQNIIAEVEHGEDMPPPDVSLAAIRHLQHVLAGTATGVSDRAASFTVQDGGVYRLLLPSATSTGITTVDAAYHGAQLDTGGM